MLSSKCTHIRTRDTNDYDTNVEDFIEALQKKYKIDFRSLPRWEKLVRRLHVAKTDRERKIQDARLRKSIIVEKLYVQSTRPSPFELTAGLCRTANKWRQMEIELKKKRISVTPVEILVNKIIEDELEHFSETIHQNTEIFSTTYSYTETEPSKVNVEVQVETPSTQYHLPVQIFTNPHKLISPLGSQVCAFTYKSFADIDIPTESNSEEWLRFKPTSSVKCTPTEIILTNNTLKQQFVQFSVLNHTSEYMHIRFLRVLDDYPFFKTKILPSIPKRLYPGIAVVFKLIFKLKNKEEFKSGLYFKVGHVVRDDITPESLFIPITSAFIIERSVAVSETITMPPVYPWHIKRNNTYSTGSIRITVNDPYTYHLRIYKRLIDLSKETDSMLPVEASEKSTEITEEKTGVTEVDTKKTTSSVKVGRELHTIYLTESMAKILNDIVELSLDTFIFKSTYLYLQPYSKAKIPVYFTKAENIGYNQSYYDLKLLDPETEKVVITKTIKVFAEVLPNPIQIHPIILDMTQSPVSHGYCEDVFVITNSHKLYPVTVQIKLTTKMKKMFNVQPMEAVVPTSSCVSFAVTFCSRDFLSVVPSEDFVHFTFKIRLTGYKAVYENVPPIFYEVIAPCVVDFKKVYNEKYFIEE